MSEHIADGSAPKIPANLKAGLFGAKVSISIHITVTVLVRVAREKIIIKHNYYCCGVYRHQG